MKMRNFLYALASLFRHQPGVTPYTSVSVNSKYKSREQFGFDVHKAHLHRIKNLRRTGRI